MILKKNMKKTLLILLILTFFTLNYPVSATEYEHPYSRIGRLPCPLVLKNCTTIQSLEENEYLPPRPQDQNLDDYTNAINNIYTSEELQNFCKSCVVKLSRDSKCINRGIKKCRKNFSPSS